MCVIQVQNAFSQSSIYESALTPYNGAKARTCTDTKTRFHSKFSDFMSTN